MATLDIPDSWHKFILERDNYRNVWLTWAIVDDHWYKGVGTTVELSFTNLENRIANDQHVGKLEPARYAPKEGKAYRQATIPPSAFADIDISSFDIDL